MPERHILAFARADLPARWLPECGALPMGSAELAEAGWNTGVNSPLTCWPVARSG